MCWLRLRNARYLAISPFLSLSKVEILGFGIPFLLRFSLLFPISSVTLEKTKAERRSCRPVKPCERLTSDNTNPNPISASWPCHCPIRDKAHSHGLLAHLCLFCLSSGLWLQSQICLVSPACWSYLLPHLTSDSYQNSSTQTFCTAASGAEQEGSRSMPWSHQC